LRGRETDYLARLISQKKMKRLTRKQTEDIRAIAAKRDRDIDFSDAPPVIDSRDAEIGKFHRPKKKPPKIPRV
jgi:hypothetical protein